MLRNVLTLLPVLVETCTAPEPQQKLSSADIFESATKDCEQIEFKDPARACLAEQFTDQELASPELELLIEDNYRKIQSCILNQKIARDNQLDNCINTHFLSANADVEGYQYHYHPHDCDLNFIRGPLIERKDEAKKINFVCNTNLATVQSQLILLPQ